MFGYLIPLSIKFNSHDEELHIEQSNPLHPEFTVQIQVPLIQEPLKLQLFGHPSS